MQKQAAPDPKHKALKQHKKNWNKAMKELITRMIAFKRALNGTGDDRYALPASKIHEPLPQEMLSFINTLSSNYEAVAAEALKITNEQNEFAKARQEQKAAPKTASLNVEGSNKMTRLWQYIKSPFLSENNKRIRIGLLKTLANLEAHFEEFEGLILSSGDKSLFKAIEKMIKIDAEFGYLFGTFNAAFGIDPSAKPPKEEKKNPDPPGNIKPDISSVAKAEDAINDIINMANIPGIESQRAVAAFDKLVINFKHEKDADKKVKLADQVLLNYKQMLDSANKLLGKNANSFAQLFEQVKQQNVSNELNVVASNFLTRWLKKQKHKISPFDRTSGNRLDIAIASEEARQIVDELMDTLEGELTQAGVQPGLDRLLQKLIEIKTKMLPFQSLVRGKALEKAFDPSALLQMISSDPDEKQVNRLNRRYDTLVDNKILNKIL